MVSCVVEQARKDPQLIKKKATKKKYPIQDSMVEEGFARAYPKYPFSRSKEYLAVEAVAKKAKKGLWGSQPAAPVGEAR